MGVKVQKIETQNAGAPIANSKLTFSKELPQDQLEVEALKIDVVNPLTFQEQIINIFENVESYEEAFEKLMEAYPDINTNDLEENLNKYISNSAIQGAAEIEQENPNG